tara:strand:+ start:382 stop:591 length:210 start_codon:yes stop_codon:yes gene_type:complete
MDGAVTQPFSALLVPLIDKPTFFGDEMYWGRNRTDRRRYCAASLVDPADAGDAVPAALGLTHLIDWQSA